MPKQGTEYELFVKEVYEILNKTDGLSDVQVQHDVKLAGAAGVEHQIDLFWTFTKAGVQYRVAVECKDYKSRISKEKIEAFHSILRDIGNITGIFASRMGFQSGAEKYAKKYGIQLMEIREPIDRDWDGKIKTLQIDLHVRSIAKISSQVFIDEAKLHELNISLPDGANSRRYPGTTVIRFDEMIVKNTTVDTNSQIQLTELVTKLPVDAPSTDNQFILKFKNGMMNLDGTDFPVSAIQFTYDVFESVDHIMINGENEIKAIVKDEATDSITQIRRSGDVIK